MERLSGMDAGFLYAETPAWHMHAGAVVVLDPSTAAPGFGVDTVREVVGARLPLLGLFRHRLVESPLGLGRPRWVAEAELDLFTHIRRVGVPAPGGPRELAALAADIFEAKLDRSRPLWEVWYVEGLADGRVALVVKVHHACVDGIRGAAIYEVLYDVSANAPFERPGSGALVGEPAPSGLALLGDAVTDLAGMPVRVARTAGALAGSLGRMIGFRRSEGWNDVTLPFQAPRSRYNGHLTPRRGFAFTQFLLDDTRAVRRAFDAKLNDVVLAVCTGALREHLLAHDDLPAQPLVAQIPVGVRQGEVTATEKVQGNAVATMWATLPTHLADPVERLRAVQASTRSGKEMQRALGDDVVLDITDAPPPAVLAAGVKAMTALRLDERAAPIFNVLVSNVPGPPMPLYVAGARACGTYPFGPLLLGCGLNLTVLSEGDKLGAGITVCPDIVDDPWAVADHLPLALDELLAAARSVAA